MSKIKQLLFTVVLLFSSKSLMANDCYGYGSYDEIYQNNFIVEGKLKKIKTNKDDEYIYNHYHVEPIKFIGESTEDTLLIENQNQKNPHQNYIVDTHSNYYFNENETYIVIINKVTKKETTNFCNPVAFLKQDVLNKEQDFYILLKNILSNTNID